MFSRFPSHSYRSKDFSNFSFNLHVLILISLFFLFCFHAISRKERLNCTYVMNIASRFLRFSCVILIDNE